MALTIDEARDTQITKNVANETYQSGNDHASTPSPTWDIGIVFEPAAGVETHIGFAYEAGVDNTSDDWTPHVDMSSFFLPTVTATTRF